ncbi:MAG: aldehyde dehydrogenase EutE [Candidatus Eisenbacteria bacterium]|nr:aldehyde dehydrogenase EutE [Candidatus Eisenbacteria bacterium]
MSGSGAGYGDPGLLGPEELNAVVEEVLARLGTGASGAGAAGSLPTRGNRTRSASVATASAASGPAAGVSAASVSRDSERASAAPRPSHIDAAAFGPGLVKDLDDAMTMAQRSFDALQQQSLEARAAMIEAIRACVRREAPLVAEMAVQETALGRAEDKVQKNLLVGEKTPGIEVLEPWVRTGDRGLTLQELAPWGVIAAITPSTNPTETIICNGIGMLAAGNTVVFCPHPLAQRTSAYMIASLNRAIAEVGGPEAVFVGLLDPTIEKAQALMTHSGSRMLVVTGGPGVVKEAMRSGKRVVGAGPGNPPAVVDETADIEKAGKDLVRGASLDNNIICTDEKEVFVVSKVADRLKEAMRGAGAYEVHGPQIDRLADLVLQGGVRSDPRAAHVKKEWVGKDAGKILEAIGISAGGSGGPARGSAGVSGSGASGSSGSSAAGGGARSDSGPRLIIAEVGPDHPFVWTELLMPILPIVRMRNAEEAMDLAILAEKGNRHTASMHSHDVDRLSRMARRVDCSIFIKNGPNFSGLGMGGEGYTSFTIAGPTGDGMTNARTFARLRRCTLVDAFRIV